MTHPHTLDLDSLRVLLQCLTIPSLLLCRMSRHVRDRWAAINAVTSTSDPI